MPLNNKTKTLALTVITLFIALNLSAWSITDSYQGNTIHSMGARNLSMGNTGVFDDYSAMSVALNPANLSLFKAKVGFAATDIYTRNEDNRSIPLYNSFDTYIDDAIYSSNINLYDDFGLAGFGKVKFGRFIGGLGISYMPIVTFDGDYAEQVRNNRNSDNDTYPEIIAVNSINSTGNLNALGITYSGGIALSETMEAHLGVTYNMLSGKSEYEKSIRWSDWAIAQSIELTNTHTNVLPDSVLGLVSDMKGSQIKIGTNLKFNERFGLGISYAAKTSFDRDTDASLYYGAYGTTALIDTTVAIKDEYILPSRLRVGFNYQPRNIMRTSFNAEIEYVQWTEVSDFYEDAYDLHVGVEHIITNRIPLRIGFQSITDWIAYPDYSGADDVTMPTISAIKVITPSIAAGSSVQIVKNLVLDIGLSFAWREYQALDMFGDKYYDDKQYSGLSSFMLWPNTHIALANRDWNNPDKVLETFTTLTTGLTFNW